MTQYHRLQTDIKLALNDHRLRPVYAASTVRRGVPQRAGSFEDLATIDGRDNLGQAIVMRLLTPRGELAALGHPDYGSRLHEMIGRENTETNRNLIKLHILESLKNEARIAEIRLVSVEPVLQPPDDRISSRVRVRMEILPLDDSALLAVGPFTLEI